MISNFPLFPNSPQFIFQVVWGLCQVHQLISPFPSCARAFQPFSKIQVFVYFFAFFYFYVKVCWAGKIDRMTNHFLVNFNLFRSFGRNMVVHLYYKFFENFLCVLFSRTDFILCTNCQLWSYFDLYFDSGGSLFLSSQFSSIPFVCCFRFFSSVSP